MNIRLSPPWTALVAVALLVGLVALSPATSQASVTSKSSCGKTRAYYRERHTRQYVEASSIHARHLSCQQARDVAHKWARHSRLSYDPAGHGGNFRCHYKRLGSDIGKTTCRKGSTRVHFWAYDSSPYH